jgi:hypothetical protein
MSNVRGSPIRADVGSQNGETNMSKFRYKSLRREVRPMLASNIAYLNTQRGADPNAGRMRCKG